MNEPVGDTFQKETKYDPLRMSGGSLEWSNRPELYKTYADASSISLPAPGAKEEMSLTEILKKRKSIRDFSERPLEKAQLSYLLWASTGIQRIENGYEFRTAPSAGALYPIETYLVINDVEEIARGVYHYSIKDHALEGLKRGNFGAEISSAALGQGMCAKASVVFVWTAIFERSKWKYKQRAYRYIYLDAGHIAGNLALAAAGLRLGSCQIGALFDDEVNKIIGVDGTSESTIYMSVVGWPG